MLTNKNSKHSAGHVQMRTRLSALLVAAAVLLGQASTGWTATASESGTDASLLTVKVWTEGGSVFINQGEEDERYVKVAAYDGVDYIDAYDKDGILVSSAEAEENGYAYIYGTEDAAVSLYAEADDGYEVSWVWDAGEEKAVLDEPAEGFSYWLFMDGDKSVSFEFSKSADETAASEAAEKADEAAAEEAAKKAEREAEAAAKAAADAADTAASEAAVKSEEAAEEEVQTEAGTEAAVGIQGEVNLAGLGAETEAPVQAESAGAEDTSGSEEAETVQETDDALIVAPGEYAAADAEMETEAVETEMETEAETEAETEHFLTPIEGVGSLDASAFASKRLIVMTEKEADIIDTEHLLSSYENIYLLEYRSVEQAMTAYLYYMDHANAVEPDIAVEMASDGQGGESPSDLGDGAADPVAALSEASDIPEAGSNGAIALIDTGVEDGTNIIGRISLIDDQLSGNGHGDDMVAAITSINPDARILSIRALGDNGQGTISSVVSAIEYAIEQNVGVINLSLSAKASLLNSVLKKEIQKAAGLGIIVVGAAGNNGEDASNYMPGAVAEAYIIGACDENGTRLPSSNYGATVDYNVVSESTSEAAAKFSGYVSLYGTGNLSTEGSNGLIYVPSDVQAEEAETEPVSGTEGQTEMDGQGEKHRIFISNAENYTITVPSSVYEYSEGEEVTFIAEPEEGFELGKAYYMQCEAVYLPSEEDADMEENGQDAEGSAKAGEFFDKSSKESPDSLILFDETQKEAEETYSGSELAGTSNVLVSKEFTFTMPDTDVIIFCDGAQYMYTAATTVTSVKLVVGTTFWTCPTAYQSTAAASAGGVGTVVRHAEITQSNGKTKTVAAYCLQPALGGPSGGDKEFEEISNGTKVSKLLYYAEYNGITWGEDAYYVENNKKKTINFKDWFEDNGITSESNCRFILHMALAYAYGVDDWNYGTGITGSYFGIPVTPALNSKGIALVEELIGYIEKLATPGSSFSSTSVTASYDTSAGKSVSESVTFKGDYGNTATVSLPDGISLVNETTGTTSTGTVVVNGKDKFHLEADSTITGTGTYSFATKFATNFEAYKIKQAGVQNIGFMWRGTTKKITLSVTWPATATGSISLTKASSNTTVTSGNSSYSLAGAVYGVYTDSACTSQYATMTTDSNGNASVSGLPLATYYVKEKTASPGYTLDTNTYTVTLSSSVTSATVSSAETPLTGDVTLYKSSSLPDMTTGNNCYSLDGAVYGIYTNAACTSLYGTMTTSGGAAKKTGLPFGTYYVKEISASTGFELNTTVTSFTVTQEAPSATIKTGAAVESARNDPLGITITKIWDGDETLTVPTLAGTQFTIRYYDNMNKDTSGAAKKTWVIEIKNVNGTYTAVLNDTYLVTNLSDSLYYKTDGTVILPYGTYTIQETKPAAGYTLNGYVLNKNRERVSTNSSLYVTLVDANSTSSGNLFLIGGNEYSGYNTPIDTSIKIVKKNSSGKPLAGVEYELQDSDGNIVSTGTTNSAGEATFSGLYPDIYTITELKTVEGYSLLVEPFTVEAPTRVTEQDIEEYNIDESKLTYDPVDNIYYIFDLTYEITDTATFKMPMTGTSGFWKFGIIGMALIAAVTAGMFAYGHTGKKRKIRKIG